MSDAAELRRQDAVRLDHIDKDDRHVFKVDSGDRTYVVGVDGDGTAFCQCPYQQYNDDHCKHELAAIAAHIELLQEDGVA